MKQDFSSEANIYSFWEKENFFPAVPTSKKKPFSLLIPPPNLTGELHLGHAMQHSILDAIARFRRLQGYDVLMLPGVDHAGIQFEGTLDKILGKVGLSKQKLGREGWLARAWQFKDEVYKSFHKDWTIFGISADWSREVFTLDPGPQRAVFEQFKTYYDRGLIYKGPYIVQWCPKCNTAIEDVEVEYDERKEKLYYLKYGPLTLATARPETKFGDTAMAVNPKDKRYKDFVGKEFEIETLAGKKKMRVVADEAVDPKFGTGVIKVTPGHDFIDYEIGKRHGLPILQVIDKNGRLTELAGKYAGMKVYEAREAMIPHLKEKGILVKEEDYVHNVAICERCKSVVEPLISEEWFVKVQDLARGAIKVIRENKINFLPKNYAKILLDWLSSIHDWCISRSLWWGHRIPVWYPSTHSINSGSSTHSARSGQVADMKISLESPGPGWVQDEQVLDTWFSSGLWPLSTLGWPGHTGPVSRFPPVSAHSKLKSKGQGEDNVELRAVGSPSSTATRATNLLLDRYFPWDFEISAPEIKYLWIARMIMISVYFTGQIPFKTMFFHGMLRDLLGRKFSKSLGNGIEPNYLIEHWGVDATRMVLYSYSIPGRDGRVSREILDERGKNFRNFATKLRNIARFILELKPSESAHLGGVPSSSLRTTPEVKHPDDRWILAQLGKTIKRVTKHLDQLELHLATEELYNFVWHEMADVYIEKSKDRRAEAQPVLENVLKKVLILLHPFMPFLTEDIYQGLGEREKSIMMEEWPGG